MKEETEVKDKKWLKDSITKVMQDLFSTSNPNYFDFEKANKQMRELVDQLDEPKVLSQKWINEKSIDTHVDTVNGEIQVTFILDDLKKLLVPKQELPVIPDYVAEYIKNEQINGLSLKESLEKVNKQEYHGVWVLRKTSEYLDDNFEKYIDAYRNGYTVEEKKYRVLVGKGTHTTGLFLSKSPYGGDVTIGTNLDYYYNDTSETHLTEEEIKNYDERFWPFREPVEELEE